MSIFVTYGPFMFGESGKDMSEEEAQQEKERIQEQLCELMYMRQQYHDIIKEQRYALRDSKLCCQYGTSYARLDCISDYGILWHRKPVLTVVNCTTENIHGFGSCRCPEENYAGRLPMTVSKHSSGFQAFLAPGNTFRHICVPLIGGEDRWKQIDGDLLAEVNAQGYAPLLMDNAVLVCQYGGIISICEVPDGEEENSVILKRYVVLGHNVNIREEADTKSKVIRTHNPAERIDVIFYSDSRSEWRSEKIGSNGDIWAEVDIGEGERGWVDAEYIIPDEPVVTTFPKVVIEERIENGILTKTTHNPTIKWGQAGRGHYNGKPLKSNDRYIVVGGLEFFEKNIQTMVEFRMMNLMPFLERLMYM